MVLMTMRYGTCGCVLPNHETLLDVDIRDQSDYSGLLL